MVMRPPRPSHFRASANPIIILTGKNIKLNTSLVDWKPPPFSPDPEKAPIRWAPTINNKKARLIEPQNLAIKRTIRAICVLFFIMFCYKNETPLKISWKEKRSNNNIATTLTIHQIISLPKLMVKLFRGIDVCQAKHWLMSVESWISNFEARKNTPPAPLKRGAHLIIDFYRDEAFTSV